MTILTSSAHAQLGGMGGKSHPDRPTFIRGKNFVTVVSPRGDQIASLNALTGKTTRVRLCKAEDVPDLSTIVQGPAVVATLLRGPKILRIAASDDVNGTLIPQDLVEPSNDSVSPIIASGIACYVVGDHAYAFSPFLKRWGVVKLPPGHSHFPEVGPGNATVFAPNHIYTFTAETGKWEHFDFEKVFEPSDPAIKEEAGPKK